VQLIVGSSDWTMTAQPDAPVVPGLWCYRVDRRRPLLAGALSEGGNFVD
jgi:hypothetical protein